MTDPETVGVRGMQRAVAQQEQLLPPVDEATVYGTKLSQIVVDLAFIEPITKWHSSPSMNGKVERWCQFCDGPATYEREDFIHDTTCVWWRAAVLTRPETGL